jgi:hypothetical protein
MININMAFPIAFRPFRAFRSCSILLFYNIEQLGLVRLYALPTRSSSSGSKIAYQRFTDLGLAGGGVGGGKKDKKNAGEEMRDCLAMIDTVKVVRNHGSRLCN